MSNGLDRSLKMEIRATARFEDNAEEMTVKEI